MTNQIVPNSLQKARQNPVLVPLGDCGLLVRFGDKLTPDTNATAVLASKIIASHHIGGVLETCPSLVSVFIRYDPRQTSFMQLCHQVRLALTNLDLSTHQKKNLHNIIVEYGGDGGPDLLEVCRLLNMSPAEFIAAHNQAELRVLAIGFAPGFAYCGLHSEALHVPRRKKLHERVPPGSIIFAAGQTAITATNVPTGWHVIGRTKFRNFTPSQSPPTLLNPGDQISFEGDMTDG